MDKYMDYYETLKIVENFMEKSGIRKFCSEICEGQCCGSCYTSDRACHKNEGRRLACSTYFCGFNVSPDKELTRQIREAEQYVIDCIRKVYINIGLGKPISDHPGSFLSTPNKYFKVPPKELFTMFKAKRKYITCRLNLELAAKIRFYMDILIKAGEVLLSKPKNKQGLGRFGKRMSRFKIKTDILGKYYVEDAFTKEVYI